MTGAEREHELMKRVDASPGVHEATSADEEEVLQELYGDMGDDGIFRGEET